MPEIGRHRVGGEPDGDTMAMRSCYGQPYVSLSDLERLFQLKCLTIERRDRQQFAYVEVGDQLACRRHNPPAHFAGP